MPFFVANSYLSSGGYERALQLKVGDLVFEGKWHFEKLDAFWHDYGRPS